MSSKKSMWIICLVVIAGIATIIPSVQSSERLKKFKLDLEEVSGIYKEKAKEKFGETVETTRKSMKTLRELLKTEKKLRVPIDDDAFLIKFLRYTHFDSKAFVRIKNYYNFKRKYKEYSSNLTLPSVRKIYENEIVQILPTRSKEGSRIAVLNIGNWDPSEISRTDLFRAMVFTAELLMMEPMTQVNGVISVVNFDDFSFKHLLEASPSIMRIGFEWGQDCIVLLTERAYVINHSFIFNIFYAIAKPFIYESVVAKIHFDDDDYSRLINDIGSSNLERRFGGEVVDNTPFGKYLMEEARNYNDYFREMNRYGYVS